MADVMYWLRKAVEMKSADIFIGAGRHISFKLDGFITPQSEEQISITEAEELVGSLYKLANRSMFKFLESGDDDFPISIPGLARFRVCVYRQRGTMAAAIRVVLFGIPDYKQINIPDEVMKIASVHNGFALVTGPAGSGKTTTLACIVDSINQNRSCHVITLEDPIEYLHTDSKSLISQREISTDTTSYLRALTACMRQSPDIVLLGEMRDYETIKTAITAAETGHLLISTLHTMGAVNTIDRIIDVFPPEQQQQIRVQLSMTLKTVVSQQLLYNCRGELTPVFEIMHLNNAIRNLIRESKIHQIDGVIQTSASEGMVSMDASILKLYQSGEITAVTAISAAANPDQMTKRIENKR